MRRKEFLYFVLIISVLLFAGLDWSETLANFLPTALQASILYVKSGAEGNCTTWASACELQTALNNANTGDQIWVAAGTYKPTTTDDRQVSFLLKQGVAIYGGFPSEGGDWDSRDWMNNSSILSGDIGEEGNTSDNSYHVVYGDLLDDTTAVLDGFTISKGNANGTSPNNMGGGMWIQNHEGTITNVIFSENEASSEGGGMYNVSSDTILTNLTFYGNHSMYGGGLYTFYSSPTLTDVTFENNSVTNNGGGIYIILGSPSLKNIMFVRNVAGQEGGGMYISIADPTLTSVTFSENEGLIGGGMAAAQSSVVLTNVTFSSNVGTNSGGGVAYTASSNVILTNVTFWGNEGAHLGGAIKNDPGCSLAMTNAILWGNIPDQIYDYGNPLVVTYSDIQGGYPGEGNIDADPLLGELADYGGFTLTHALNTGSGAIDGGDINNCPETDQRGVKRPIDGDGDGQAGCDMGAYEVQAYIVNIVSIGEGDTSVSPDATTYDYYDQITLTATADTGWIFSDWSGDVEGTDNPITTIVYSNTNITATFTQIEYTLSVTINPAGSGSVTVDPLQTTFHYGDVVTLAASANPGWTFAEWSGDASGTDNPLTVDIQGNTNITATFTRNEYTLTVNTSPEGSGNVWVDPFQMTYHYGDVITLTANGEPGWSFTGWSGDASGIENPLTIIIHQDLVVNANFRIKTYLAMIMK